MKILIACEFSGVVRDAFINKGHDAWSCDVLPTIANPARHFQCDVFTIIEKGWDMLIAHPPAPTYVDTTGHTRSVFFKSIADAMAEQWG